MNANTPVKVINPELELAGQAGVVHSATPKEGRRKGDETVDVRMDATGDVVTLKVADLQALP